MERLTQEISKSQLSAYCCTIALQYRPSVHRLPPNTATHFQLPKKCLVEKLSF